MEYCQSQPSRCNKLSYLSVIVFPQLRPAFGYQADADDLKEAAADQREWRPEKLGHGGSLHFTQLRTPHKEEEVKVIHTAAQIVRSFRLANGVADDAGQNI